MAMQAGQGNWLRIKAGCGVAPWWPGSTEVEGDSRAPSRDTGRVVSSQKGGHGMTQATFPLARHHRLGCHTRPCC